MATNTSEELSRALAKNKADKRRLWSRLPVPNPKIKPLVLALAPTACVRKDAAGRYDCYIDGKRLEATCAAGCGGGLGHSTPNKAWACLAHHVTRVEFGAAR